MALSRRTWVGPVGAGDERPMCGALITGGWYRGPEDEGHYGIRLDLDC